MLIFTWTSLAVPVTISLVATPMTVCSPQHRTACLTRANYGGQGYGRGGSRELGITGPTIIPFSIAHDEKVAIEGIIQWRRKSH